MPNPVALRGCFALTAVGVSGGVEALGWALDMPSCMTAAEAVVARGAGPPALKLGADRRRHPPLSVPQVAGIQQLLIQTKRIETGNFLPLSGLVGVPHLQTRRCHPDEYL